MTAGSFTISRAQVRDNTRLSLEAVGLLAWLTSHTDAFIAKLDEDHIRTVWHLGRDKCRRILRELATAGYLIRQRLTDRVGLTTGVKYAVERRPRQDGFSVKPDDQPKHDVSAGRRLDGFSGEHSHLLEDTERSTKGVPVRNTRARTTPPTPQSTGEPMPQYRQTRLPIIGPRTRKPGTDIEPASPGDVVEITPQARSLNAMQHVAATICDEWLQRCYRRPPTSFIRQVEVEVYTLVADAIPDDDIRRGLALWMSKGYAPSTIPSFVNQAMNHRPQAAAPRASTTDARVAAALSLVGTFDEATG